MSDAAQILIATPSRDQTVSFAYMKSVFEMLNWFKREVPAIAFEIKLGSFTSLDSARNYYATLVLEQARLTHLLFIDSDHGFPPELIRDMITFDKPVVGAIYPAKTLHFGHVFAQAKRVDSAEQLEKASTSYVRPDFVPNSEGRFEVTGGFARVHVLGTGLLLIQRSVFERMAELPNMIGTGYTLLQQQGFSGRCLQCFRPIVSASNIPMGEDVSFCVRWTEQCGGELWANVAHEISHIGPYWFKGRFMDRLR